MSSLNKIRLEDGTELSVAEWLHQPVFSTLGFGSSGTGGVNTSALDLTCFNYVVGQRVSSQGTLGGFPRNATEADTNLVRKRSMNQDEALIVFALTYEVFAYDTTYGSPSVQPGNAPAITAADLRRLQRDCLVELFVGAHIKKPQVGVPFAWIHQSIGAPAWASVNSGEAGEDASMFSYGTGGAISARNQELLKLPVYIGGFGENAKPGNMMTFYLKMTTPFAIPDLQTSGVTITWHLDGLKKRPA